MLVFLSGVTNHALWLSHQVAIHNEMDEFSESVFFGTPFLLKATSGWLISEIKGAAEGIGEESMSQVVSEKIGMIHEIRTDVGGAVLRMSAIVASSVDRDTMGVFNAWHLLLPPLSGVDRATVKKYWTC